MDRIIRRRELCELTGLSYSSIYRRVRRGLFPRPIALGEGGQAIGWFASEVDAFLKGQKRITPPCLDCETPTVAADANNVRP